MADTKISARTDIVTLVGTDVFAVVKDPSGSPLDRQASMTEVVAFVHTNTASTDLTDTANICYLNTVNDFGDFAQTFTDNTLKIENNLINP